MDTINLTLNPANRLEISTTIENLINMLDALESDPDLEPWLGSLERHPASYDSPWGRSGFTQHQRHCGQENWGTSDTTSGEDDAGENAEVEESGYGDVEGMVAEDSGEPSLGLTEEINQERRTESDPKQWYVEDGEPELGWTGHGTGCIKNEPTDDREGDDEREPNGDEEDSNRAEDDHVIGNYGGGDGSGRAWAEKALRMAFA